MRPLPPTLPRYATQAEPPQFHLSPLDNVVGESERSIVLYFRGTPLDAQRLRQSLEQLLGNYPVLAGRLKKNEGILVGCIASRQGTFLCMYGIS